MPTCHQPATLPGRLFVVSAPSGTGKTTICRAILARFPDLYYSISSTTRAPRSGEKEGVDYFFISKAEFEKGIQNDKWVEWAEVHGNYYGTSADFLKARLAAGNDVLLDIDVQGAMQVKKRFPACITIFIAPPSMEELRRRLEGRNTDTPEAIRKRLDNAVTEMTFQDQYAHVIVNLDLDKAIDEFGAIVQNARPVGQ